MEIGRSLSSIRGRLLIQNRCAPSPVIVIERMLRCSDGFFLKFDDVTKKLCEGIQKTADTFEARHSYLAHTVTSPFHCRLENLNELARLTIEHIFSSSTRLVTSHYI